MNCKEFEEIAESYLCGELLVETNHDLMRHLDHCSACRRDLREKRALKSRLRHAVRSSSSPLPDFTARLRSLIAEQSKPIRSGIFVPALAFGAILLAAAIGLSVFLTPGLFLPNDSARTDLEEILHESGLMSALHDALGTHQDCGLKFGKGSAIAAEGNVEYDALRLEFSDSIELVEKHDCYFNGRKYSHTVLRNGDKLISVLKTESKSDSRSKTIVSVPVNNMHIAEFQGAGQSVFVISDLPESQNIQIARVISAVQSV